MTINRKYNIVIFRLGVVSHFGSDVKFLFRRQIMASQEIIKMKAAQVEEIKSKIESAKSVILINYSGLTVAQDTELRRSMRQAGVDYTVYKNRLAKRAFNELGYTDFDEALNGPTAIALSTTDPAAPAKVLSDKIKELKKMEIKCGLLEGNYIDAKGVKQLADLPSKEVILAMLLGALQAPITGLAGSLNSIVAGLAIALGKVAEQKA